MALYYERRPWSRTMLFFFYWLFLSILIFILSSNINSNMVLESLTSSLASLPVVLPLIGVFSFYHHSSLLGTFLSHKRSLIIDLCNSASINSKNILLLRLLRLDMLLRPQQMSSYRLLMLSSFSYMQCISPATSVAINWPCQPSSATFHHRPLPFAVIDTCFTHSIPHQAWSFAHPIQSNLVIYSSSLTFQTQGFFKLSPYVWAGVLKISRPNPCQSLIPLT